MPLTHTAECIARQEAARAWTQRWRHHCRKCYGARQHYYPARTYRDGSGDPPGDEPCTCTEWGICPRCGLPIERRRIGLLLGYHLNRLTQAADKWVKRKVCVEWPRSERERTYKRYNNRWRKPIYLRLCNLAQWLAGDSDADVFNDELACAHCGWRWGHNSGDFAPLGECMCDWEA